MVKDYHELNVYRSAYSAAMQIFELSKSWPKDEKYALTSQIRRSSRSVCANIAEAWCKRRYEPHFVSKLSDAEAEAAETQNWISFAFDCGYLAESDRDGMAKQYDEVRGGLVRMMATANRWCGPSALREPTAEYAAEANGQEPN
jgi:four helix bundle protein